MDFYIVLGIEREASLNEIKRAYRRLARQFHPDVNPGDERAAVRFGEIARAYETLSDPERRRRYDQYGHEPAAAPGAGFEGFDFSATVHAVRQSTFGDLFEEVFRASQGTAPRPERGADLHASVTVGFEEALRGTTPHVTVVRQDACGRCAGTGLLSAGASPCAACGGTGATRTARGHMLFSRPCARCRGTGTIAQACLACGGSGRVSRSERVIVPVGAGTNDGTRVRVPGRGNAGRHGGPPGDLYVDVQVTPHPLFRREGDDLHLVVPVAVHEAALGTRVEIPVPDGSTRLRVPPGTQSGQRFRLRGRGALSPRDGRPGDLVVEVRVMLPRLLDERSKQLLRLFGEINGADGVREQFDRQWRQPPRADVREGSRG